MTTLFGPCIEGSVSLDERLIAAYAEIYGRDRCARLAIPWDKETNPSPGVFNLGMYVENCKKLKAAGFVVLLGNNWAPEHASEGVPTYVEYDNGSSFWTGDDPIKAATCAECGHVKYLGIDGPATHILVDNEPTCRECAELAPTPIFLNAAPFHVYRPIGLRVMAFAKWRDCASNPRHIYGRAKYDWSRALAQQLGPYTDYASDMNEPGVWSYWPPMSLGQDIGLRRLFNESYIPWARAFQLYAPHVKRIGIEAQGADEIWRLRELERESGLSIFPDGIAYHYPLNQEDAYDNWGLNQPWKDERPRFVTEAGYADLNLTLQELRQTMARPVKPRMFIFYQNIGQGLTMVDPVTFKANAFGEAIKKEIQTFAGGGGSGSGAGNEPSDKQTVNKLFAELWSYGMEHSDYKERGVGIGTETPGGIMLMLASALHSGSNAYPNADLMKRLAELIDARFKQPLLGEVKVIE